MANNLNLANYLAKVPELTLDNYDAWQNKVQLVLQLAQVDKFLTLPILPDTSAADKSMSVMVLGLH